MIPELQNNNEDQSNQQDTTINVILTYLGGKIIGFNANLARALGSNNASLFLQQCLYWVTKTADEEGWFYKTIKDFREELNLSRWEQEQAIEILMKYKILEKKIGGIPAKRYFRINFIALKNFLENSPVCEKTTNKFVRKPQTSLSENHKLLHRIQHRIQHSNMTQSVIWGLTRYFDEAYERATGGQYLLSTGQKIKMLGSLWREIEGEPEIRTEKIHKMIDKYFEVYKEMGWELDMRVFLANAHKINNILEGRERTKLDKELAINKAVEYYINKGVGQLDKIIEKLPEGWWLEFLNKLVAKTGKYELKSSGLKIINRIKSKVKNTIKQAKMGGDDGNERTTN